MALRPGLKSKDQTLVRAMERERKVGEQAALILHKERCHSAGVLVIREQTIHTKVVTRNSTAYGFILYVLPWFHRDGSCLLNH